MSTVWFFEFTKRLDEVMAEEVKLIGLGSCTSPDHTAEQTAMWYNERIGFVSGLKRARQIAEEMEKA